CNPCKPNPCDDNCGCHDHCKCDCEPCEMDSDECFENKCGPECCNPISPRNFSVSNAVPFAIEANRIFDTMQFQTFTDATGPNGEPLTFETEVVEVFGSVPSAGKASVTIEKICLSNDGIVIDTGMTTLEDFDLDPLGDIVGRNCETTFEFAVCGERNAECCRQGKGKSVAYKQRGLTVAVRNLVLELRGRCGCTEFVALAFPAVRAGGGCKRRVDYVEFTFNTLSAPICLPADGRAVTLRQEYQTNLTVDCIGKSILKLECNECCEPFYELIIPNDIDLVLCLQNTVSTLISEQIVVLASPNPIQPRLVDTFSKVCDFSQCGPNHESGKPSCHR
ncbi:exosporium morphogenetic protein CdeC, partial [Clostridioides difficile]